MIEIGTLVRVKDNYPVGYDDVTDKERERHGQVGTVASVADGTHTYNDVDFPDGSIGLFRDDELEVVGPHTLTIDERRTYQSLVARGVSPEDAYQDALDGIHVDDVRYEYKTK